MTLYRGWRLGIDRLCSDVNSKETHLHIYGKVCSKSRFEKLNQRFTLSLINGFNKIKSCDYIHCTYGNI